MAAADIGGPLLVESLLAGRPGWEVGGTAGDIDREEEEPVGEGEGRGLGEGPPLRLPLLGLAGSVLPGRPSSLGERPPS